MYHIHLISLICKAVLDLVYFVACVASMYISFWLVLCCLIWVCFLFFLVSGLHLVLLPKDDDPSKAVLAACNEKELIRLAAQKCKASETSANIPVPVTTNGRYLLCIVFIHPCSFT